MTERARVRQQVEEIFAREGLPLAEPGDVGQNRCVGWEVTIRDSGEVQAMVIQHFRDNTWDLIAEPSVRLPRNPDPTIVDTRVTHFVHDLLGLIQRAEQTARR